MSFAWVDLTPRIGTEIKIDKKPLLNGSVRKELRALLEERGVLLFRNLDISEEEQIQFGATIGTVRLEHGLASTKIIADKNQSPIFADYTEGTYYFHIDGTYTDTPGLASILKPKALAPAGGQTEFCNTYALYEDLPPDEQRFLCGLQAVHSLEQIMRCAFPNPTEEQLDSWGERRHPPKTHPLVWEHKSGRKSLILAYNIKYFVGMHRAESDSLLARLLKMAEDPQYIYAHNWEIGDMLIWDNTGTMHRVIPFDPNCGRELTRVTLLGEEQITAAGRAFT